MSSITQGFVRGLRIAQRELIVKHVEGPQPFIASSGDKQSIMSLLSLGLLKGDANYRPRFTMLTEPGREAAAVILGQYADALVAAGCLEPGYFPEAPARHSGPHQGPAAPGAGHPGHFGRANGRNPGQAGPIGRTKPVDF